LNINKTGKVKKRRRLAHHITMMGSDKVAPSEKDFGTRKIFGVKLNFQQTSLIFSNELRHYQSVSL
jgi:hypothetical protein